MFCVFLCLISVESTPYLQVNGIDCDICGCLSFAKKDALIESIALENILHGIMWEQYNTGE